MCFFSHQTGHLSSLKRSLGFHRGRWESGVLGVGRGSFRAVSCLWEYLSGLLLLFLASPPFVPMHLTWSSLITIPLALVINKCSLCSSCLWIVKCHTSLRFSKPVTYVRATSKSRAYKRSQSFHQFSGCNERKVLFLSLSQEHGISAIAFGFVLVLLKR